MPVAPTGSEWIVLLEASDEHGKSTMDPVTLNRLVTWWPAPSPTMLYSPDRYALQVPVTAVDPPTALSQALSLWKRALRQAELPHWDLVRAEVMTANELERELRSAEWGGDGPKPAPEDQKRVHNAVADDLLRRALQDSITGLPDRELFHDDVCRARATFVPGPTVQAVVVVHIGMPGGADRLAPPLEDDVLAEVARRLLGIVRDADTVGRAGPAEFGLLVEVSSAADTDRLARRIVDTLLPPLLRPGGAVALTPTVGVATTSCAGDGDDLFLMAETAMSAARTAGADCR